MKRGCFITFEGGEGAGKSTQLKSLRNALENAGIEIVCTREPGGASGAEEIRRLLVTGSTGRWTPKTELLLHYGARMDHVDAVVEPALDAGKWVVCDRFHDSTMAYQGYGQELGVDLVQNLHSLLLGSFRPDLTLIFDLPVQVGLERTRKRNQHEDRYEKMDLDFHERLRVGFLEIAKREPDRCIVLDASKSQNAVYCDVITSVNERLALSLK